MRVILINDADAADLLDRLRLTTGRAVGKATSEAGRKFVRDVAIDVEHTARRWLREHGAQPDAIPPRRSVVDFGLDLFDAATTESEEPADGELRAESEQG